MSELIRALMLPGILSDPDDPLVTIDRAADVGCNCVRMFGDYYDGTGKGFGSWNEFKWLISPCKTVDIWNPGALVGVSMPDVPIRDLDQKNPFYWEKLEAIFAKMYERRIVPWFVGQDFCSTFLSGWERFLNTFFDNIQRYPGYKTAHYYDEGVEPKIGGERIGAGLDHYYWQYASWVVALAYKVGHRRIYLEPWNEVGFNTAGKTQAEIDELAAEIYAWFGRQFRLYKNLEGSPKNIEITVIGSCRPPLSNIKLKDYCEVIDAHCIIENADIPGNTAGLNPAITILDSDGAPHGKGTSESFLRYHNMSLAQGVEIGTSVKTGGWRGFAYMPQEQVALENGPFVSLKIDMAPFKAANEASGWVPSPPPPPPPPPVEYITVKLCTMTGKVPNQYCPATFEHTYVKGMEQTEICTYHVGPPPPPPRSWF